ncbi:aminotransferase class III-fold pyridoxal phosphate-dependent enzyme [uncultured Tateyamaria sp.]|uniref:aminotransferase class III-fold pyridoxal phosphate-dependent enzyme n=1 Tax=uncultured Tateyamaria sp. TaxID=455651 RepID=UPI00261FF179|nr:aminotransferase class III-fold pyridoxal phosphate-dependent enzyme [uncultured Tateyamaria sp.]
MKDSNFLKEHNARQFWHPMAHPADSMAHPPTILTGGEGVYITDVDGHRSIDAVGGLWNVNLGYSCQPVKDAISAQLEALPYYSTFRGTSNDKAIELAYLLAEFFGPDGMTRSFFTSGGSDSIEIALKLARQYHRIRGDSARTKFISLDKGYHGTHFGGASVNGNAKFRNTYEPLMAGCFHIPGPYLYRNPFGTDDPAELARLSAGMLEREIAFQGANTIAAFVMEPVQGAGGVIPPHPSFMPMVRDICDKHGVLLIADEVITAFGRAGTETGSRHWGVRPDLMCTAKAITNGYFPFGAVMIADHVAAVFEEDESGVGSVDSGYTYSGHPVGAAAAVAAVEETMRIRPWDAARARGPELKAGLEALQARFDVIGDVRGEGLMCAIELVSDRAKKTPIGKALPLVFQKAAYADGVMIRVSGNNAIFSPPLVLDAGHVQKILSATETGLKAMAEAA